MFTYDHSTLRLFGVPIFSIVVGFTFIVSVFGFFVGVSRWRQPRGKVISIAAGLFLFLFALAVVCVLVTVGTGSMG